MMTRIEFCISIDGNSFSSIGDLYESSSSPPGRREVSISEAGDLLVTKNAKCEMQMNENLPTREGSRRDVTYSPQICR